jgi:hypothetical protein
VRPFGATFTVVADDARVLAGCDPALARYPQHAGAQGELVLVARTVADTAIDPAWPEVTVTTRDDGLEVRCGSGRLRTSTSGGRAELDVPASLLASPDAVRMFVEAAAWSLLIGRGEVHAVHSGLVRAHGQGLLLRGPSGAGKSTLSYACLRAGHTLVSDDWVYGTASRPPDTLHGQPWRLSLVADAADRFPELAGEPLVPHPSPDRWKLAVAPPVRRRRISSPVDAVVFLDPHPVLALRPCEPGEAAQRFWATALVTERRDLPGAWVDGLLDRPAYVLQRGTDPDAAAAQLVALAQRRARSAA